MLKKIIAGLLFFSITNAFADTRETGWYVGLQLGQSDSGYTNSDINGIVDVNGIVLPPTMAKQSVTTDGWGIRPYFGYQINPFFGLELGFAQFADVQFKNIYGIPGYEVEINPRTTDLVAKVMFPISSFNIYAKLGLGYLQESLTFNTKSLHPSLITDIAILRALAAGATVDLNNDGKIIGVFGLGASYFFNKSVSADISWTRYQDTSSFTNSNKKNHGAEFDFVALGVSYYLC